MYKMLEDLLEEEMNDLMQIAEGVELQEIKQNELSKIFTNAYFSFSYAISDTYVIFYMYKPFFGQFEYFCGMEYEKDFIKFRIETEQDIYVFYSNDSVRALKIIERIDPKYYEEVIK